MTQKVTAAVVLLCIITYFLLPAAKAAEEMAGENGIVFWRTTRSYDAAEKFSVSGLTKSLSTVSGRESLAFACTDKTATVLYSFLSYLSQYKYTVRRISETSIPILFAK